MNNRIYILFTILLAFLVGCSSSNNEVEPNKSYELEGSWIFAKYSTDVAVDDTNVGKSITTELSSVHELDSIIWVFEKEKKGRVEVINNPLISDEFTYSVVDNLLKVTFSKSSTGLPENPSWRDLLYKNFKIEDNQLVFDKDYSKEYQEIYPNLAITEVMQYTHYKKMTHEDRFFGKWIYFISESTVVTNRKNTTAKIKEDLEGVKEKFKDLNWTFATNGTGKVIQNSIESPFTYTLKTNSDTISILFAPDNELFTNKEYGYSIINNELRIIQSHAEYYGEQFPDTKITTAEETQIYTKVVK